MKQQAFPHLHSSNQWLVSNHCLNLLQIGFHHFNQLTSNFGPSLVCQPSSFEVSLSQAVVSQLLTCQFESLTQLLQSTIGIAQHSPSIPVLKVDHPHSNWHLVCNCQSNKFLVGCHYLKPILSRLPPLQPALSQSWPLQPPLSLLPTSLFPFVQPPTI